MRSYIHIIKKIEQGILGFLNIKGALQDQLFKMVALAPWHLPQVTGVGSRTLWACPERDLPWNRLPHRECAAAQKRSDSTGCARTRRRDARAPPAYVGWITGAVRGQNELLYEG